MLYTCSNIYEFYCHQFINICKCYSIYTLKLLSNDFFQNRACSAYKIMMNTLQCVETFSNLKCKYLDICSFINVISKLSLYIHISFLWDICLPTLPGHTQWYSAYRILVKGPLLSSDQFFSDIHIKVLQKQRQLETKRIAS